MKLSDSLRAVPLDNPVLVRCFHSEIAQWGEWNDRAEGFSLSLAEEKSRTFGRYGFDGDESGDAEAWLLEYANLLDRLNVEATGHNLAAFGEVGATPTAH